MDQLSAAAEAGREKSKPQRHRAEQELLATLNNDQRSKWLDLEETIYQEQNNVQEAMIEAFICPTCTVKTCQ
jgi:hypothetical protein